MARLPRPLAVPALVAALLAATTARAQTLQQAAIQDRPRLAITASGNVRDVLGKPDQSASATGSISMRYTGNTYLITTLVNVAARIDTITESYGASLLPPASGRGLNAGLLDIRRRNLPFLGGRCQEAPERGFITYACRIGVHHYTSVSSLRWATELRDDAVTATADVPVIGTGTGLSYRFFSGRVGTGDPPATAGILLDIGFATRSVRGDLLAQGPLRTRLLGSSDRDFRGLEGGLTLEYNNLRAGITYYSLGGGVSGLSRGQVVAGISIEAVLNQGRATEDK